MFVAVIIGMVIISVVALVALVAVQGRMPTVIGYFIGPL